MLSVIIPVWNQGREVKENFLILANVLKKTGNEYEVIFIDDGSSDNTFNILHGLRNRYFNIAVIKQKHLGQHPALFEGFKAAKGGIIITMDADQTISPSYIPKLIDKINQGYEIAVAWDAERQGLGLVRRLGSWLINRYTNMITGKKTHQHACSLKAYKGQLIRNNLHRKELSKFFGILIAKYANAVTEIKVSPEYKHNRISSFTFTKSLLLLVDFIFVSINMRYASARTRIFNSVIFDTMRWVIVKGRRPS